nr:hypothetical protein [Tanacetum cinerariifolium]
MEELTLISTCIKIAFVGALLINLGIVFVKLISMDIFLSLQNILKVLRNAKGIDGVRVDNGEDGKDISNNEVDDVSDGVRVDNGEDGKDIHNDEVDSVSDGVRVDNGEDDKDIGNDEVDNVSNDNDMGAIDFKSDGVASRCDGEGGAEIYNNGLNDGEEVDNKSFFLSFREKKSCVGLK